MRNNSIYRISFYPPYIGDLPYTQSIVQTLGTTFTLIQAHIL